MTDLRTLGQLRGKTALVTGGTDGIGKEVARRLAQQDARLIIVGRDPDKGARAESEIRASSNNDEVAFIAADLSLMRETMRVAEEVASRFPALNYMVHSAGVVRGRRLITEEGIESNFATNYLSRFAMTVRLLANLRAAWRPGKSARIVLVAHPGFDGTIHWDDVNLTRNFAMIRAFRQFHYANDLFATELTRRLHVPDDRTPVTISCLHPGPTKHTSIDKEMPLWMKLFVRLVVHTLASRTPDVPASTTLRLLLDDEYEGESGAFFSLVGRFKRVPLSLNVMDPKEGERLWELSESLIRSALRPTTPIPAPIASRVPAAALQ